MANPKSPQPQRTDYQGVDVMKFLMALCVVLIHVISQFSPWQPLVAVEYVITLAVPFFFVTSGFLLAKKIERDGQELAVVKHYALRIWRMYFCWIAIYVPLCVASNYLSPTGDSLPAFLRHQLPGLFTLGQIRYSWPTWYLFSLAIATSALYFARRRGGCEAWLAGLGAAGMAAAYLWPLLTMLPQHDVLCQTLQRWSMGLLCVSVGMSASDYLAMFGRSWLPSLTALLLSVFLASVDMPFWQVLGGFALFAAAMRFTSNDGGKHTALLVMMRKQSMWVYLVHMYVLVTLYFIGGSGWNPWVFWLVTCGVCVVLAWGLTVWSGRPSGRFLRRLT